MSELRLSVERKAPFVRGAQRAARSGAGNYLRVIG